MNALQGMDRYRKEWHKWVQIKNYIKASLQYRAGVQSSCFRSNKDRNELQDLSDIISLHMGPDIFDLKASLGHI